MGVVIDITSMVALHDMPNRIRERRLARHPRMTQTQLADAIGTKAHVISRFETGDRDMTMPWLRKIAKVLGCTIAELLAEEDNPYALSDQERAVIDAMRSGDRQVARLAARMADNLIELANADEEPERKRA